MSSIKNHQNKNRYLLTRTGHWVRDMFKRGCVPVDINDLIPPSEYGMMLDNVLENKGLQIESLSPEEISARKVLIVSDGLDFDSLHRELWRLPKDVCILATNRAAAKWSLLGKKCPEGQKRAVNYFVANNPYREAMGMIPRDNQYYPKAIMSYRTHPDFVRHYLARSNIMLYHPTRESRFVQSPKVTATIDDYRNPICAAVSIAAKMGAYKIALLCCDQATRDERPGMIVTQKNTYIYKSHNIKHSILDGMFHWIRDGREFDVEIVDCSNGMNYENASYIGVGDLPEFFEGKHGF